MTEKANSKTNADVASLTYEQARDELIKVVADLEQGSVTLEESMTLWERGEALADQCETWLTGARKRLDDAVAKKKAK
jgi:exodeoxyribonuclease VII small subunit